MIGSWIFRSYARISRASRRSSRRVSERGQLIQLGIVITAALGVDTELTLIYQLFTFLLALYFCARLATRWQRPQLALTRHLPRYVTAGEPFRYRITVTNLGSRQEPDLRLTDNPLVVTPDYARYSSSREPGEEQRNAWDRFVGFHRFLWLQRRMTGLFTTPAQVPTVPLRGAVDVWMEATPLRRGRMQLNSMTLAQPDPLGLVYGFQDFAAPAATIALPKRYPLRRDYCPPGGRHYQPGGISAAWSVGESDEFISLRDYREGDSLRRIHWASSAKRDKPVVREHQDEFFVRQALVLDTCTTDDELLEDAVAVAASFAARVDSGDSLLDLIFVADAPYLCTGGRGTAHAEQLLEVLSGVGPTDNSFSVLRGAVLQHARLLSGVLLILLRWDEERRQLARALGALGLPLEVLLLGRGDELPPPEERIGVPLRLLRHDQLAADLARL